MLQLCFYTILDIICSSTFVCKHYLFLLINLEPTGKFDYKSEWF
jgi:hypothetical protein